MSDSTDSNGSVIFVAEQHTVRVQVHQPGDPTVVPETQQFSIAETQDDTPTSQGIPLQKWLSSLKLRVTILGKTQVKSNTSSLYIQKFFG